MKLGKKPTARRAIFAGALLWTGTTSACTRGASTPESDAPTSRATESQAEKTKVEVGPTSEKPSEQSPTPSPFRLVLSTPGWVTTHGGVHYLQTETFIQNLSTGEFVGECPFLRGFLASGLSLFFLARMSPYSACPDQPLLMRKSGESFKVQRSINAHQLLITRYKQGTLGVVVPHRPGPPWGYELVSLEGPVTPPKPQKAPRPKTPESEDSGCYTLLEQPEGAFGFESGALIVLGQRRCETPVELGYQDESERPSEQSFEPEPSMGPVAETWRPGQATSTLTNLPLGSIQSSFALHSESVWVLGDEPGANEESADTGQALLHFDGATFERVPLPTEDAVLSLGSGPSTSEAAPSLWLLTNRFLTGLHEEGRLRLPPACQTPHTFWFEKEEAWLSCEEGVFSTDDRGALPPPTELDGDAAQAACEKWEPRPTDAPPPLFGRKVSGGCGQRDRQFETPGRPGKPGPHDPHSEIGW